LETVRFGIMAAAVRRGAENAIDPRGFRIVAADRIRVESVVLIR
jgi:hypothetical protein